MAVCKSGNTAWQPCYCEHSEAAAAFRLLHKRKEYVERLVGKMPLGRQSWDLGQAPNWCPRRLAETPVKITKSQAYQIIDQRKPIGMFYLEDGSGDQMWYTGIDNLSGDAWTEDFETRNECMRWLNRTGGY